MLLSAVSVLVVAQSSSEIPEGLMNKPVYAAYGIYHTENILKLCKITDIFSIINAICCIYSKLPPDNE